MGHFRNQTVLEREGYFVRKQSPDPKMTEVTGILSIAFWGANLYLTVAGNQQDNAW